MRHDKQHRLLVGKIIFMDVWQGVEGRDDTWSIFFHIPKVSEYNKNQW